MVSRDSSGGGHGGPAGGARKRCPLILHYEIDQKFVVTLSGRHCGHALGPVSGHSGGQLVVTVGAN